MRKTNWTLIGTSLLMLAGIVLAATGNEFLRGAAYAFLLGALLLNLRSIFRILAARKKHRAKPAPHGAPMR